LSSAIIRVKGGEGTLPKGIEFKTASPVGGVRSHSENDSAWGFSVKAGGCGPQIKWGKMVQVLGD